MIQSNFRINETTKGNDHPVKRQEGTSGEDDLGGLYRGIHSADELDELKESSSMMYDWAPSGCVAKIVGGMEEWAKSGEEVAPPASELSCDWYHGTWQFMRLLNMVAVPRWYEFYRPALSEALIRVPNAKVMISGAADYGMLQTLHDAIQRTDAGPHVVVYDICETPLKSCRWYAERHNLDIECHRADIIASRIPEEDFDIIVTDEFLTVLRDSYKPLIVQKWKQLLRKSGVVVTTAMMGGETTPALRERYATQALELYHDGYGELLDNKGASSRVVEKAIVTFAAYHTRYMVRDEAMIKRLFQEFSDLTIIPISTPGECVNPTESFQVVARKPA